MSQKEKVETKPKKDTKFKKNNTVGKETRFKKGNSAAVKYSEDFCDAIIAFFNTPPTRVEYKETYYKGELTSRIPIIMPAEYPTFELFAASIGVTTKTLLNWAKEYPRFSDCYARAKEIQLGKLKSLAITGLYNPVYAKFEAVNNHEQKDKSEVEGVVKGLQNVSDKDLALIRRVEERLANAEKNNKCN